MPQLSPGTNMKCALLALLVGSMGSAKPAVLLELQFARRVLLVLGRSVITLLALGARQGDYVSHFLFPLNEPGRALSPPTPSLTRLSS